MGDSFYPSINDLKISFPTVNGEHYGEIMMGQPTNGEQLLSRVIPGIERAMALAAAGKIAQLEFHVSPPYKDYIRKDFKDTIEFLTTLAKKQGLRELNLTMFPSQANRTGLTKIFSNRIDFYRDFFARYHNKRYNGVKINLTSIK